MNAAGAVAYCGPAPVPAELLGRWNLDPWLLTAFAGAAVAIAVACRDPGRRRAYVAAWVVLAIAFVSPLCAATVALFSARAVHHVLLVAVAAPLLALAGVGRGAATRVGPALLVSMAVFYAWHVPALYDAALASPIVYWAMQASLLAGATRFWAAVLDPRTPPHVALPALLATVVLMGMLGALLTFAPRVLYAAHAVAPIAFGIDPLDDQRLAGLVMWVPALLPYLALAGLLALRWAGAVRASA